ncbi:MAG: hypothetical protein KDI13_05910 [Alphaproteobacteria bacterium]|nr:hypothetical protein [Alphaproteobacteria bacterium]
MSEPFTPDDLPPKKHQTIVRSLTIDEGLKDQALNTVRGLVKGNKFDPDDVKLAKFDGEVLQFQAETIMQVATKISRKTIAGRVSGPVQVANQVDADTAVNAEYLKLMGDRDMSRKIREVVLNRDDQGFALDKNVIPLPFWKKEFVYYEGCPACRATGTISCRRCGGKGMELCPECRGSTSVTCTQCHGGQQIQGPQGNKIPCPTCHGRGKMSCRYCRQSGRVQCKVCRTRGETTCTTCNGHAWNSNILIVEIEARTAFEYPKEDLPEKVVAMIDARGVKIREDAEIHVSQIATDKEEEPEALQGGKPVYRVPLRYEVILPYAHTEFDIGGKSYYSFLFGITGRLSYVSPFLDDLIKNGVRKLEDAAEGRGDVAENLQAAAAYRTVREVITSAALYPVGKAMKRVKQLNPIGLSDDLIKAMVAATDTSLKTITDKPRTYGMIGACAGFTALFAAYFLTPLRSLLLGGLANSTMHIAVDLLLLGMSLYLGVLAMQIAASGALRRAMKGIIPAGHEKKMTPKLGTQGLWAGLGIAAAFVVMMELSRHVGAGTPPEWYAGILAKAGI